MTTRKDKQKNIDKATASLVKNPLQTEAELAKDIGVGAGTAHRAKVEVEKNGVSDNRIQSLTDKDLECVELGVKEINRRLQNKGELEKMRTPEISQVIKENTARYTLFKGDATDEEGGLKDISAIDKLNSVVGGD